MNKLIYFHGFGSSGEGSTVRSLRELLPEWEVLAPDIPVDPAEALPFLRDFCKREQPNVIVGTSIGRHVCPADAGLQAHMCQSCIRFINA